MDEDLCRKRFRMIIPTYPAFNIYSRVAHRTTALGPVCVASVVNRMHGWRVEVIDENNYRKLGPRLTSGHPDHATLQSIRHADVVGLYGGLSSTALRIHELAQFYKRSGAITIAGGQHFVGENIREALENGLDFVVIGEGEHAIKELLSVIQDGGDPASVDGIAFMKNGEMVETPPRPPITDFEALPLPDFSLLRYARIKRYPVGWMRGCNMNCEFCTVKGKPRASSPERVVEQMAALMESCNARRFFLVDDQFGHSLPDTMQLCELLANYQKAVGARFDIVVQIRLDLGDNSELLKAMRKAGIRNLCIGFESPIEEELAAMNKHVRAADMLALTKRYHRAGFFVHGMFIFGYPLRDAEPLKMPVEQRVKEFRHFIRKSQLDTIQVMLPVPLPGTALTERLAAENRIFSHECIGWEYYDGNFPLFMPDAPLTPRDMQRSIRKIMGRFYRFRNMFVIGRNILIFPALFFALGDIRLGWRIWYRTWRNGLVRFGGWMIFHQWVSQFSQGRFGEKLHRAEELRSSS